LRLPHCKRHQLISFASKSSPPARVWSARIAARLSHASCARCPKRARRSAASAASMTSPTTRRSAGSRTSRGAASRLPAMSGAHAAAAPRLAHPAMTGPLISGSLQRKPVEILRSGSRSIGFWYARTAPRDLKRQAARRDGDNLGDGRLVIGETVDERRFRSVSRSRRTDSKQIFMRADGAYIRVAGPVWPDCFTRDTIRRVPRPFRAAADIRNPDCSRQHLHAESVCALWCKLWKNGLCRAKSSRTQARYDVSVAACA